MKQWKTRELELEKIAKAASKKISEGKAGVAVAQSKKVQKKLRASGHMEEPGHYHKKGEDWESTKVIKPKKLKEETEKKQPNVAELKEKALAILFKHAEVAVKEYGQNISDVFGDIHSDANMDLMQLYEPYEWTKELEKMDNSIGKSRAVIEKMFKEKYGMSPQKWIDTEDKKAIAALPDQQRKVLLDLNDLLITNMSPHDLKRGALTIYKQSKTGVGIRAWGMELILRPAFFTHHGLTVETGIELLKKMGASMTSRPKRIKYSPSLYD